MKTWTKYALYGGGALGGLLGSIWLWRRFVSAPEASQLADATDTPRAMARAEVQVRKAKSREALADYRKAEGLEGFWKGPSNNAEAYFYAAFWLAVTARTTGIWTLTSKAATALSKGKAAYAIPGSSKLSGNVRAILADAADAIRTAAPNRRQASAVLAALKQQGTTVSARASESATQSPEALVTAAGQSVQDAGATVGFLAAYLRGLFTGETPSGMPAWKWALLRYGTWIGVGVGGVVLARAYLGGHVARATQAVGHLTAGVQQARAALTTSKGAA